MAVTATELRQLARALGTPGRSKLAPMANTGVTTPEMQAMADKLTLPSAWAKLLPESPSECTPICLEAIEGQPAYSYLGTDADGNTGVFVLPASTPGLPDAPADNALYARRNNAWEAFAPGIGDTPTPPGPTPPEGSVTGILKGQVYAQLSAAQNYIARLWIFNGTPGTANGWL